MEDLKCEFKRTKMDIANLIEFNDKEEANAIINYNDLLTAAKNSDLSKAQMESAFDKSLFFAAVNKSL